MRQAKKFCLAAAQTSYIGAMRLAAILPISCIGAMRLAAILPISSIGAMRLAAILPNEIQPGKNFCLAAAQISCIGAMRLAAILLSELQPGKKILPGCSSDIVHRSNAPGCHPS
ncbi:hypothetical protein O6H91_02G156300 [Diphasiastrum complanatum]|uniref:Uncharacterized protein n=1 Tax=Diphasiastrum complanatum TaxID=34168 RepID=A0ACC2EMH0_DIPCM|nr:hypothetical protein O6H91_02G156300 [Diphasiastrum complanatum]